MNETKEERMRFEIEADIPDGFDAVAYRKPAMGEWIAANYGARPADTYDVEEPWLILREKPLAYEDFDGATDYVSVEPSGLVRDAYTGNRISAAAARSLGEALIAAADHVDRVNAQKNGAA